MDLALPLPALGRGLGLHTPADQRSAATSPLAVHKRLKWPHPLEEGGPIPGMEEMILCSVSMSVSWKKRYEEQEEAQARQGRGPGPEREHSRCSRPQAREAPGSCCCSTFSRKLLRSLRRPAQKARCPEKPLQVPYSHGPSEGTGSEVRSESGQVQGQVTLREFPPKPLQYPWQVPEQRRPAGMEF